MLKEILTEDLVAVDVTASTKEQIIEHLLDMIRRTGKVNDRDLALRDILENESRMSTGLEQGIAIPHAKTTAVDELVAGVAVTRHNINFESLDHRPARIFIMTLSPKGHTGPHIQFLAEVSRLLKDKNVRRQVLAAGNSAELLEAFVGSAAKAR